MPEITNDELGRTIFTIQRDRAVEETVDKIRLAQGDAWTSLSHPDRQVLERLLGEAWVSIERKEWERYAFARLNRADLERLIALGYELDAKSIDESVAIERVRSVLKTTE
jgi:hypothetical protein